MVYNSLNFDCNLIKFYLLAKWELYNNTICAANLVQIEAGEGHFKFKILYDL